MRFCSLTKGRFRLAARYGYITNSKKQKAKKLYSARATRIPTRDVACKGLL